MTRAIAIRLAVVAVAVFAGAVRADVVGPRTPAATEPPQGFIVAVPQTSGAAAANKVAEEPERLPPTEVRAYREERVACDRRQGVGQEACRAQLAAKYAEMDKLCRNVSGTEFPVCIKSAYAPD